MEKRWVELLNDYECEIMYHPSKENMVADTLSGKEYSGRRVKTLTMTIHSQLSSQIKEAQLGALKLEKVANEELRGMDKNLVSRRMEDTISWTRFGSQNLEGS